MRKALVVAAVAALSLLGTRVVADASTIFHANMTFDQEVPTVPAFEGTFGVATFVLNDAQTALSYDVTIFGLNFPPGTPPGPTDLTRLHIHRGPAGVAGPIVFGMIEATPPPLGPVSDLDDLSISMSPGLIHVTGVWDNNEGIGTTLTGELTNLFSNNLYINAHTGDHASGEIRGLISAVPAPSSLLLIVLAVAGAAFIGLPRRIAA
jgi:hypothetical protein